MRYALSPPERAFKEAVRGFVERALEGPGAILPRGPESLEVFCDELTKWLTAFGPARLSRVEEAVAFEEIARRLPESGPRVLATGLFAALSPALRRAAADLGEAQGALAPALGEVSKPEGLRGALFQDLADALAGIEAARLKLYRAAILEDAGRGEPDESAGAEGLARDLAWKAGELKARITTGGENEIGSAVPEGGRDGHRQRPEGRGGDREAPRRRKGPVRQARGR